ncbi:YbjN domain-containing protein [Cellulomonas sp. NPDC057328]|uniref:YbjN domain-containing protein n=1 Tax=Cellulomonas sp. NPDC057328 TaxID=3346101 RepID=UPI0036392D09
MAFFTKPTDIPDAPTPLAPLTQERITETLERREMRYGVDDDGDIGGYWDGHLFYFFRLGDNGAYLQVRGRWNRPVPVSELDAVTRLVNEWNAERLWPKGYVRAEDAHVGVYAEHTVDYQHGLTDDQLDTHLACSISTGLALFEHLDEAYPEIAAAARAELEKKD